MITRILYLSAAIVIVIYLTVSCGDSSLNIDKEQSDRDTDFTHTIITDELEVPWQMAFTGDGRILITEIRGVVRIVKDDQLLDEYWLDLRPELETSDGSRTVFMAGLQGIAVDPDFSENGYVYIGYAYEAEGEFHDFNRLVRYKENPQTGKGEFDQILVDHVKGRTLHNASQIKFGPDDKIYWGVGDRSQKESAQDPMDASGSILRINPDGTVPSDNPFPDSYVFSYGNRNAQGFDWHPDTEMMLATEHGPSSGQGCCHDEINIIEKGNNYGWPEIRGDEEAEGMVTPLLHSSVGEPVREYTWAPSGAAFVKSGPWRGTFLFGGLNSQSLWQLVLGENYEVKELNRLLPNVYFRTRTVDQNPENGAIYLATSNLDRTQHPIGKDFLVRLDVFYVDEEE